MVAAGRPGRRRQRRQRAGRAARRARRDRRPPSAGTGPRWTPGTSTAPTTSGCSAPSRAATAQAEQWYRRAAYAGHREAANALAILLLQRGDAAGAEPWFSKAAEAGSVDAAFNLGHPASPGGARSGRRTRWYERAAAAGHTEAALQVGIVRLRDGDEQDAERHLRCAAGGGSAEAAYPARRAARRAAAAGAGAGAAARSRDGRRRARSGTSGRRARGTGARRCGWACCAAARGDVVEAARWYRAAAEAGQPERCLQPRAAAGPRGQ